MLPVTVRLVSLSFWRLKASQRYHDRPIDRKCHRSHKKCSRIVTKTGKLAGISV
nr:unnamed protein product [Callosobruchus chinensis]